MTRLLTFAALLLIPAATLAQNTQPPPSPTIQQQVTVTSTRSSTPLGETAHTTDTLTPAELTNYPSVTLDETLRQHAGFELFRRAPSRIANPTSEGISLRGLGSTAASRTLVLEDGAPLNDPFGGYIHWNELPQQAIAAITLVTGGGSDLYGSSALSGVIDVTPATPAPSRLELFAAGAAQDTSNLRATFTHATPHFQSLLAGESLRTAGYIVVEPTLAGPVDTPANVRSQAYHAELGRRTLATKRLFLTGNLLNEDRSNGTAIQTNATRLWRYLGGYDLPETDHLSARARIFGSQQGYRQSFSAIAVGRATESLSRLQRVHTQEFGFTADATVHVRRIAAVFGTDLRDLRATDNETPIAKGQPTGFQDVSARQRFLGGFGELLGSVGKWSVAASVRADRISTLDVRKMVKIGSVFAPQCPENRTEVVVNPRFGLVRAFTPNISAHGSIFRAFRTPTFNELYRTGQVGQEITLPNATLTSERATGFELGTHLTGFTRSAHPANFDATYFYTVVNRPVSAVLVSQTATTITNKRENLGQLRSRGVEAAAHITISDHLSTAVEYQFAQATVTANPNQPNLVGNQLPQVPAHSVTALFRVTSAKLGDHTLSSRFGSRTFDDAANHFALNRFFALDLAGSRTLRGPLSITYLVQNMTNSRPQVSRAPILTLGSPTFFEIGLRLTTPAKFAQ